MTPTHLCTCEHKLAASAASSGAARGSHPSMAEVPRRRSHHPSTQQCRRSWEGGPWKKCPSPPPALAGTGSEAVSSPGEGGASVQLNVRGFHSSRQRGRGCALGPPARVGGRLGPLSRWHSKMRGPTARTRQRWMPPWRQWWRLAWRFRQRGRHGRVVRGLPSSHDDTRSFGSCL